MEEFMTADLETELAWAIVHEWDWGFCQRVLGNLYQHNPEIFWKYVAAYTKRRIDEATRGS
jgi:hypothetical protein